MTEHVHDGVAAAKLGADCLGFGYGHRNGGRDALTQRRAGGIGRLAEKTRTHPAIVWTTPAYSPALSKHEAGAGAGRNETRRVEIARVTFGCGGSGMGTIAMP